jgi:hypothetical protein
MSHFLEHCLDPRPAIQKVVDLLAPGGVLCCEVPDCGAMYFQIHSESQGLDVGTLTRHGLTRHFSAGWRAWGNQCHALISGNEGAGKTPRRSMDADLRLLARTAFAAPSRKFDCLGVIAHEQDLTSRA